MREGEKIPETEKARNPRNTSPAVNSPAGWNVYGLVFEVGYTVALPLVFFALLGRYLDRTFHTSPWLLLAGIVLSVSVSSALVYRKVSKIIQ